MDSHRKTPIIWIHGPAGSGKTTLIAHYLDDRQLPCLWYQLDKTDNEIANFFYYLGLAVKKAAPENKPLPLLSPEYVPDIPLFARRYFEEAYSYLTPPLVMVFDNYQDIPEGSLLHEVIRQGLHGIPEGVTLIFASREDPPADMAPFQTAREMKYIEWKELRFTLHESKGIMKLRSKTTLSNEIMLHIQNISHGWIAGLILILLRAEKENIESLSTDHYSLPEIFDYFAHEVVKKLDKPTRDFLLKTAFLPQMTSKMAEILTGNNHAGLILSELNAQNCFLEKRHTQMHTYRYHPLFKEFLMNLDKTEFSTEEIAQLHYRAAELLEESHHVEEAAELYVKTGAWDKLIQLIFTQAELFIR